MYYLWLCVALFLDAWILEGSFGFNLYYCKCVFSIITCIFKSVNTWVNLHHRLQKSVIQSMQKQNSFTSLKNSCEIINKSMNSTLSQILNKNFISSEIINKKVTASSNKETTEKANTSRTEKMPWSAFSKMFLFQSTVVVRITTP